MENRIHNGVVSRFDTKKHYGFIECENNSYFFFIDSDDINAKIIALKKQGIKANMKTIYNVGDEVNFKLKYLGDTVEAFDIEYVGNKQRQLLIEEYQEKKVLLGYLKKINDGFFVKHISTYVFLPVEISKYEIDSVYDERINQMVQFQLKNINKIDKIKAVLTDRKYICEWEKIKELFEKQEIVNGIIKHRTKGGFIVDIFGIDAFLQGGQIDIKPIIKYDVFINETMDFKIIKLNDEHKNIVLSHKILLEESLEIQRNQIIAKLEKGKILEGIVKNIVDYGIFVDLGGVDGLIHISDLGERKINHPNEIAVVGNKINVIVLDFTEDKARIQLGYVQNSEENV